MKSPMFGLITLSVLTFAITLVGCSRPHSESAAPSQPGTQDRKLTVFAWADYFAPDALQNFADESGVSVHYETFGEVEEIEARLRSQPDSLDVVVVDSYNLNKLRKLRLLHPLDGAKLPNRRHLSERYLNRKSDLGNQFSVPYMWGTTLVAYRKDKIPEPELSWQLLWNDKYRGRIMMLDDSFDPLATALLMSGKTPETRASEDYAAAAARLIQQISAVDVRYGSDNEVKDKLLKGEAWAAMCYSGDAAVVAGEDENVDYFIPKEGAPQWLDSFAIARDSNEVETAHLFINFMMRPEIAARNSNVVRYATPNLAAEPLLDESLRNDPRIYPPAEVLSRCALLPELDAQREALVNRHWHSVKRAYSEAQSSVLTLSAPSSQ
ncbi:MAG: ABC transporter substrate-binding protein [Verrucomicrobiales bacterium]